MKKSEINKEVAAIRKLAVAVEKLQKEIGTRQAALAKATCPWKPGQEVEWTYKSGKICQGRIREVWDAGIHSDSARLWTLYVNKRSSYGRLLQETICIHQGGDLEGTLKLVPEVVVTRDHPVFRPLPWFNTRTQKEVFGIQVSTAKGKWLNASENGKPLVFATAKERDAKLKELRARKP